MNDQDVAIVMDPGPEAATVAGKPREELFTYLTTGRLSVEYRQVMDLFTGPLLGDLSASEVTSRLAERGVDLAEEDVEERCRQLEVWGNLIRGVRDARVPTVREYLRSRNRYQASKLGGRVHRDAEGVLSAGEGAGEVARELLGATVATLERILERLEAPVGSAPIDAEDLAADVTTIFNNQKVFSDSVKDFYTGVNDVMTRYDLAGAEYQRFKAMLLEYIDLITSDVRRHTPAIIHRLGLLEVHLPALLAALATRQSLDSSPDGPAERLPGRSAADWAALADWYSGASGRSGPDQLRAAAEQALRQLLANAKRMLASAGTGVSRRADLLKLAGWFDRSEATDAHRLYAATFGVYSARHLLFGLDEPNPNDGAGTSWWDAEPVEVPISVRERGDRSPRGRTSQVPDPGLDRERLLAAARAAAASRAGAAAELIAAGTLDGAHVSPAARALLLEHLGDLLATHGKPAGPVFVTDTDLELVVHAAPTTGGPTVVHADDGTLTIHDLSVSVTATWAGAATAGARRAGRGA